MSDNNLYVSGNTVFISILSASLVSTYNMNIANFCIKAPILHKEQQENLLQDVTSRKAQNVKRLSYQFIHFLRELRILANHSEVTHK